LVASAYSEAEKPVAVPARASASTRLAASCMASGSEEKSFCPRASTSEFHGNGQWVETSSTAPDVDSSSISLRSWLSPTSAQGEADAEVIAAAISTAASAIFDIMIPKAYVRRTIRSLAAGARA
jgi:hypothetical protein